jgi:hypothetical protein
VQRRSAVAPLAACMRMCGTWQRHHVHQSINALASIARQPIFMPRCCLGLLGGLSGAVGAVLGPVLCLAVTAAGAGRQAERQAVVGGRQVWGTLIDAVNGSRVPQPL